MAVNVHCEQVRGYEYGSDVDRELVCGVFVGLAAVMNKTSNGRGGYHHLNKDTALHEDNEGDPNDYDEEQEEGDDEETSLDEESQPLNYHKNIPKYQPVQTFSTTSLYAATPMRSTDSYEKFMSQERKLFLFWFFIFLFLSPLVFRYAMGSNVITTKTKDILLAPNNATLFVKTQWDQCIPCIGYYGVTLKNVTINIVNVTSPDPDAKTPSIAVFASQDLTNWYAPSCPPHLPLLTSLSPLPLTSPAGTTPTPQRDFKMLTLTIGDTLRSLFSMAQSLLASGQSIGTISWFV